MYLFLYCIYTVFIGQMFLFAGIQIKIIQMSLVSIFCKLYCIYTNVHVFTQFIFTHEVV